MGTPLTDGINALIQYANGATGKQDTTLSDAVGSLVEGYGGFDLLQTLTFVDALGANGRQTVDIPEEWDKYDFLLLVPDLIITAQEGQTTGNWLWYSLIRKSDNANANNYDSVGSVGTRDRGRYTVVISNGFSDTKIHWMIGCWQGGRMVRLAKQTDEKLSDLKISYGTLYGDTYGLLNGTVKIYGGKF